MTLRKPVVDEQWLSLNRTIHQVAPLSRNPEHLENAARVLQAEGGLEALARLITTEQTAFLVLAMLEKCGAFQRTAVINGGPCVRISAGVSADAPRKAGVKLTRQQMIKFASRFRFHLKCAACAMTAKYCIRTARSLKRVPPDISTPRVAAGPSPEGFVSRDPVITAEG